MHSACEEALHVLGFSLRPTAEWSQEVSDAVAHRAPDLGGLHLALRMLSDVIDLSEEGPAHQYPRVYHSSSEIYP